MKRSPRPQMLWARVQLAFVCMVAQVAAVHATLGAGNRLWAARQELRAAESASLDDHQQGARRRLRTLDAQEYAKLQAGEASLHIFAPFLGRLGIVLLSTGVLSTYYRHRGRSEPLLVCVHRRRAAWQRGALHRLLCVTPARGPSCCRHCEELCKQAFTQCRSIRRSTESFARARA